MIATLKCRTGISLPRATARPPVYMIVLRITFYRMVGYVARWCSSRHTASNAVHISSKQTVLLRTIHARTKPKWRPSSDTGRLASHACAASPWPHEERVIPNQPRPVFAVEVLRRPYTDRRIRPGRSVRRLASRRVALDAAYLRAIPKEPQCRRAVHEKRFAQVQHSA